MSLCPSPEMLGRLGDSASSGSRDVAVEAHVETCPACQEILERLAAEVSASTSREPARLPYPERPPAIPGFVIEHELGRGGMGVVYQASQPQLARRVAIKVVSAGLVIGEEDRRRWLGEAQALGRVRHRNVVSIHQAGEQDGCHYLVLELVPGGSLAERIRGPVPPRVAAGLMATVALAVEHLHQSGIVHLDIKPSNILLDGPTCRGWDRVTPMITDFGIARAGDDPAAAAAGRSGWKGTPSYMAPEQIHGSRARIGPHTDVFALGATLYHLLTGRPPFQGASVIETIELVCTREPAAPRLLVPRLARDLETIALTCLRKDPRQRYASAADLAGDLRRWLDGFPIRARPVSTLERGVHWCRRRPAVAALLAVLALTLVSSFLGLFGLWRHAEAERGRAQTALSQAVESDRAASAAVRELVALMSQSVRSPQPLSPDRLDQCSGLVHELTLRLRMSRGYARSNLVAVCALARELSVDFRRRGKLVEARVLLADCLELQEGQRRKAIEPGDDEAYAQTLIELATHADVQGNRDEELVYLRRAEEALEDRVYEPRRLELIAGIDGGRQGIDGALAREGAVELRRRTHGERIRMLERLRGSGRDDPSVGLLAALIRVDLASDDRAIPTLRAAIERFPAGRLIPEFLVPRMAAWIASDICPDPSAGPGRPFDPEAQADAALQTLASRCEALGSHPEVLPVVARMVCNVASGRGAEQRRAGRLDDARRTAAWLHAVAGKLVRRNPGEIEYHLMLCVAFEQEAKNAWKVGDSPAIEEHLRKALGEAHTALKLDPEGNAARSKVSLLQDKLVGLALEPPSPR